ncbi:MAG: ABC transporter substrate-binding protein [Deltaproteobacteria bacterium]|nr:ABC transporter substrate-binding protein [Deltaproteobacteria bacterium]MBW2306200.1 ABC transporter substrate-binding protein [Deltaproteobacteria bacterium]
MKRHKCSIIGLIIAAMVIFSWIGSAPAAEPYRVGAIFAISGPASWLGEPERNTAQMLVEKINRAGGINGHKLEMFIEDTVGDETKAVLAVKKLINQDKVLAIIGPSRSGTSMALIPIMTKAKVPLISCAAAASIVEPIEKRKWIFKTPQLDKHAVETIYDRMNRMGIKKIAIMSGTTGFGAQGRKHLLRLAPKMGLTILADETYGPKDTDMTAQLTKIKGTGAQAVVNWSIVPAQVIVAKNMRQLGMDIPLFLSHGFGNIKYVKMAGEAAEGILFPAGRLLAVDTLSDSHPQKAVLMKYKKDYESRFKTQASTFGGHAYDAFHILAIALEKAGPDREKIRDAIENIKGFVGTGGVFNLSPQDHTGLTKEAFEMLTVKNGKFVVAP